MENKWIQYEKLKRFLINNYIFESSQEYEKVMKVIIDILEI